MIFYDFEVFEKDWLAVFIDVTNKKEHVIINSPDKLKALYEANRKDIWVGFNNRHYDQYIMKGILLGMNPKKINDWIIVDNKEGWQYSRAFNKLPMINYDVMPSNDETMKIVGLKTMEGFLGSNIKETDVDFRIKRKLTPEEIEQTVKYCRHDVEQTIKVFLEKVSEFNAVHGIIQAFPKETSLYDIGDSEARITAKVLGCSKTHFGDEFDFFFLPCLKLKKYKYVQEWFAEKRKEALEMGLQDFDNVVDHARAIDLIFHQGRTADTYNIGGFNEWKNIDLIKVIIKTVDRLLGNPEGTSECLITYVTDRKGHDLRYAIDSNKLKHELGWEPSLQFEEGIERTVRWYLDNQEWMDHITSGEYEKYYESMYKNR